ncbi:MAG: HAD family hydrolase [Spirochaetales bacterium]|jgi:phosphoglycolate phosphatase-like HAD superfamily hydrolase|nr:HAD family hydrolase [Spirochaetales bacterium]
MGIQVEDLKNFKAEKDFFIGIDSDGCAFDSMEIKHKECFCPAVIKHYNLQAVSKYAREVWDFVNLYSKTRGCNRFNAVTTALELLSSRKETIARGVDVPDLPGLDSWKQRESKLGNPALIAEVERNSDADLKRCLAWSLEVNERIADLVMNIPPFPLVRESLAKIREKADVIVVSQTPLEALEREWKEQDIDQYVQLIAGQELGTKSEHLAFASGGKYSAGKVLMIGDAPGDYKAARDNNALFFPVNPGAEEDSWELFYNEAIDRFFDGTYEGDFEVSLIDRFNSYLPENPPWEA